MTLDDITAALSTADAVPKGALTAAVTHADALAPVVFAIADKFCRGVYLLPADCNLLFYGLHVLAAARQPGLLDQLIGIARQPGEALDQLFPDHTPTSLARLLLSVWHRDAEALFHLIERADMAPEAKWALYDVLARLTFDGRIARNVTAAFLARIERDSLIDGGDMAWWGWQQAVAKLGFTELEPALRRAWTKPIYEMHDEADHAQVLDTLQQAAADPADSTVFDAEQLRAIDDPVEAVAWLNHRASTMAEWEAEQSARISDDAPDAAGAERLTEDEQRWLAGLLASRQVPADTMPFEMLDGFFTALVIGPELVLPSEYLPIIWGEGGSAPDWDTQEQATYAIGLLMKHWNAIAARRSANAEHRPEIESFGEAPLGEPWAEGFMVGIDLRHEAWDPMFADLRADQVVLPILALGGDTPDEFNETISDEMREMIVEQLPATLQMIAAYWQAGPDVLPRREPQRSVKVSRNEPCTCGSGKKFKKCCGATGSTLH